MNIQRTIRRLDRAATRFLNKAGRVNKPLQALYKTQEYKAFQDAVAAAIRAQVADTTPLLKGYSAEVLDHPDKLGHKLQNDMPRLEDYLSQARVEKFMLFSFEFSARMQYMRWGVKMKKAADEEFSFELTNENYINAIKSSADYLLHKSKIDETTRSRLIDLVQEHRLEGETIDETAAAIADDFDDISDKRAFVIARTEACNAAGDANMATMRENGIQTKVWVTAGPNPCEVCIANEDVGAIPIDQAFPSGDDNEPAHPNDECYTEAGEEIDLDSIDLWGGN